MGQNDEFEVIEVSDGEQFVTEWRAPDNRRMDFGKIPLEEGELRPDGALDD